MINFANNLILDFEKDSDLRISGICRAITGLILIVIMLNVIHVFNISPAMYPTLLVVSIILMTPTFFFEILNMHSKKIRYMVLTLLVIMAGIMYSILSYHVIIMLDEPLDTLQGVLIYGIIPRVIELIAISVICIGITGKLQRLITALVKKNNELYEEQQIIVGSLSELVETQSHETGQHVKRVAAYTEILCRAMGLSEEETWKISVASMMHDVGKICVPREILHKPGKLTEEEFSEIKKHVDYGHKLLENSSGEVMRLAANIAWQHHERYDGKGYPAGLKGETIPISARIIAVADSFDAMNTKRVYRDPLPKDLILSELRKNRGTQFDPKILDVFLDLYERDEL